jgi:hypothetical protein
MPSVFLHRKITLTGVSAQRMGVGAGLAAVAWVAYTGMYAIDGVLCLRPGRFLRWQDFQLNTSPHFRSNNSHPVGRLFFHVFLLVIAG